MKNENPAMQVKNPTDDANSANVSPARYWDVDEVLKLPADDEHFKDKLRQIKGHILSDLQSNILKAHKHKYTLFCFLEFAKGRERAVVEWLKRMPLASAQMQMEWEANGRKDVEAINLFLSYQGYEYFCDEEKIRQLIPLEDDDIRAFKAGLSARCPEAFGGEARRKLGTAYEQEFHALILIATNDDELKMLNEETDKNKRKKALTAFFKSRTQAETYAFQDDFVKDMKKHLAFEVGLRNPDGSVGEPREWFGYRDGISNPRFFPAPGLSERLGFEPDPPATLNTALRRNTLSPKPYACGSFVVFLKLEQNIGQFREVTENLARRLGMEGYQGQAGAYIMGRHIDGTPLHKDFSFPTLEKKNLNDFSYRDDQEGAACPLHAHTRKANPRDGQGYQRIIRRGKAYGNKKDEEAEKGVLFLSYQSSFLHFEDIVNRGLYGYNYNNRNVGKDVLFLKEGEYPGNHRYRNASGKPVRPYLKPKDELITFRGGQYFFASSISFIQVNLENCM